MGDSEQQSALTNGKGFVSRFTGQGAKIWGIFGLLVAICLYTACFSDQFLRVRNIENLFHRTSLFGILSIGAAFVIITGGIDLSIGSLVCLVGVVLPFLLTHHDWPVALAVFAVIGVAVAIKRWLASGPGGYRHGYTASRLLHGDKQILAAVGTAAAALHGARVVSPSSPPHVAPPNSMQPGGGSSGGGGASGEF